MSVVIAIKTENGVIMASDTMVTFGDNKRHLNHKSAQKIWLADENYGCIMGGVGLLRDIQLIHHGLMGENPIDEAKLMRGEVNTKDIITDVVPTIFTLMRQYQEMCGPEGNFVCNSEFVWAFGDRLFHIDNVGTVLEVEDYCVIGSGAEHAIASLQHTTDDDVYVRLIKALDAASTNGMYVAPPYVTIDTKYGLMGKLEYVDGAATVNYSDEDAAKLAILVAEEQETTRQINRIQQLLGNEDADNGKSAEEPKEDKKMFKEVKTPFKADCGKKNPKPKQKKNKNKGC